MKMLTRKLKPLELESGKWLQQVIAVRLKDSDGNQFTYEGDAITSAPGANHSIEFEFETSVHRPAEIALSLYVSSDTILKLEVNGHKLEAHEYDQGAEAFNLAASEGETPLAHLIAQDVTRWVEGGSPSRAKFYFFSERPDTTVTILTGGDRPEVKFAVLQKWSWAYAVKSVAFFSLMFLSALGLLILGAAHSRPLGETFQYYALITAVLTWAVAFLGVFARVRISLWPTLRRLYARTRNRRALSLILLSLVFAGVASGVGLVVYCLRQRQQYSALIKKAAGGSSKEDDEAIRQAFILMPWRREAQILFEKRAYESRDANDMTAFREYIRGFVKQKDVEEAVVSAKNRRGLPFYLTGDEDTLSDPVLWYASLLPEAGDSEDDLKGLDDGIALLSSVDGPQAAMQRMSFQLAVLTEQADRAPSEEARNESRRKSDEVASALENLLNQYTGKSDGFSFAYQIGCDTMGTYYIRQCRFQDAGLYEKAFNWFLKEIHSRNQVATVRKTRFWQRPPDKLILYYMLCQNCTTTGGGAAKGELFLKNYNYCYCMKNEVWKTEPAKCAQDWFKEQMKGYKDYAAYLEKDAWLKNSIQTSEVDSDLKNNLLTKGWRY